MRLENLYENFGKASIESQASYMSEYRLRRAEDMTRTPTWPKVKKSSSKVLPLTEEEKTIMTLMGLKRKDIIAMRQMNLT